MSSPRVTLSLKYKALVVFGVVLLALVAISAVFGSGGLVHLRSLHAEQAAAELAAFQMAERNTQMRDHLARLEKDDVYLEKVARERLGWVKPGERVFRVK
jgi:cell division protein FtsB